MNRYHDYTVLTFSPDQAVLQHKATRERRTAAVAGHLQRLPYRPEHGPPCFRICSAPIEADASNDVRLPILVDAAGEYVPEYPRCPDCDGAIASAESGRVAGARICVGRAHARSTDAIEHRGSGAGPGCGSTFVDTRHGAPLARPARRP